MTSGDPPLELLNLTRRFFVKNKAKSFTQLHDYCKPTSMDLLMIKSGQLFLVPPLINAIILAFYLCVYVPC